MLGSMSDVSAGPDRIVMLGLDGGPRLRPVSPEHPSAKPAVALVVDGAVYLVDAGLDTSRQLVASGLGFAGIEHVFLTHHHLDHTSGLPGVLLHGWTAPNRLPDTVHLWGPPSMQEVPAGVRRSFAEELRLFGHGDVFGAFPEAVGHDVVPPATGVHRVMEDDRVVVDAVRVFHGPEVADAYAYRFTVKQTGRVAVFSGDTAAPDAGLLELARGCDVLVHEAQDNDDVRRIGESLPAAAGAALVQHLLEAHSDVRDVPRVAHEAGAGRVVLSHYTPFPKSPAVYAEKAQAVADEIGYTGDVVAPEELEVIEL
jgi:ribonuclease BN (tRNA processing enzyme)